MSEEAHKKGNGENLPTDDRVFKTHYWFNLEDEACASRPRCDWRRRRAASHPLDISTRHSDVKPRRANDATPPPLRERQSHRSAGVKINFISRKLPTGKEEEGRRREDETGKKEATRNARKHFSITFSGMKPNKLLIDSSNQRLLSPYRDTKTRRNYNSILKMDKSRTNHSRESLSLTRCFLSKVKQNDVTIDRRLTYER